MSLEPNPQQTHVIRDPNEGWPINLNNPSFPPPTPQLKLTVNHNPKSHTTAKVTQAYCVCAEQEWVCMLYVLL